MLELGLLVYGLGFLASVVLPYVQKWIEDRSIKFDWRYVVSRLSGSIIPLLITILSPETTDMIEKAIRNNEGNAFLIYAFIFTSAYGASQLGQLGRKTVNTVRSE